MNPLDIYKKLPRSNCGKCPALTCMSFAIKLIKKDLSTSECPELEEQSRKEIEVMLSATQDWKEKRIQELFKEISQVNFPAIAEGIGATREEDLLKIKYMGRKITVSHSDFNGQLTTWDKLLILMYIKTAGGSSLSGKPSTVIVQGKWVAFRDLKNGLIRASGFNDICEAPLARMFEKNQEAFLNSLAAMGAEKITGFSAEHSLVIYPLPKIPFLILLWPREEDFEPACKVLLDSTATEFLDVEALLYLGQALTRAIKMTMD